MTIDSQFILTVLAALAAGLTFIVLALPYAQPTQRRDAIRK